MKMILKIFAGLVVVIVVALGVTFYYLNDIIKEAVVQIGPEVTSTRVELDSVSLSLLGGSASLKGLAIGNPEGYEKPNAFSLGSIEVDLDTQSLRDDVIIIHRVYIEAPQVAYESNNTGDNFQTLLDNIAKNTGGSSEQDKSKTSSEKKVIIEEFILVDGTVSVKHKLLKGKTMDIPLPDLTLTDIGKKTNGATAQEAASQIIKKITSAAKGAMTNSALLQQAKQQLNELKDGARAKAEEKLESKLEELNIDDEQVDKVKDLFKGLRN